MSINIDHVNSVVCMEYKSWARMIRTGNIFYYFKADCINRGINYEYTVQVLLKLFSKARHMLNIMIHST